MTISLPPAMVRQLEKVRKQEHRTRSELMREALRHYLDSRVPRSHSNQSRDGGHPPRTRGLEGRAFCYFGTAPKLSWRLQTPDRARKALEKFPASVVLPIS